MLEIGICGSAETKVTEENTAKAFCSGALEVFATPAMLALFEEAAWKSVAPHLSEGEGTVGTKAELSHISATPLGGAVRCESRLTEIDGRRLVFHVEAFDDAGKIGEGTHERFIVQNERFMEKARTKMK